MSLKIGPQIKSRQSPSATISPPPRGWRAGRRSPPLTRAPAVDGHSQRNARAAAPRRPHWDIAATVVMPLEDRPGTGAGTAPVHPVHGLLLLGRAPPRVEQEHFAGGDQIQPLAA